jgi:hypothetical protein
MRRASIVVDCMETGESGFDELYRRYLEICREEGIEPMPQKALAAILRALALGEEIGEQEVTLH